MAKTTDGVYWKRAQDRRALYYYRLGRDKSKEYTDQRQCAEDFVSKYIGRNPKYKELVYDKSWGEIFKMFSIHLIDE